MIDRLGGSLWFYSIIGIFVIIWHVFRFEQKRDFQSLYLSDGASLFYTMNDITGQKFKNVFATIGSEL